MSRAWVLHGFNVRDGGQGSIDKLIPHLRSAGYDPVEFDYGWLGPLGVKCLDGRLGKLLAKLVRPGDVVVAHSNGCCIAQLAAEAGAPFDLMVFISPALDRDTPLPSQVRERHVWFTTSDEWVGKARWIPFVRWGDMGKVGFHPGNSDNPEDLNHLLRTTNYNGEKIFGVKLAHSGWFAEPHADRIALKIVALLALSQKVAQ